MRGRGLVKAVVLAAGAGRRMRADDRVSHLSEAQANAAALGHKGMMPIGGQHPHPFFDYILSALADAGCEFVCLVIGRDHDTIQKYYEEERPPTRLRLTFVRQDPPTGTADAVLEAELFAGADPFLVLNSDNLYPSPVLRALIGLEGPGLPAFERDALIEQSGFPLAKVAAFALLDVDTDGNLARIIEKPGLERMQAAGSRALVSMNVWRFDRRIFDACRDVSLSKRGEYELPQAVQLAIGRGVRFRAIPARGAVLDLSSRADVASVTERLAGYEARP